MMFSGEGGRQVFRERYIDIFCFVKDVDVFGEEERIVRSWVHSSLYILKRLREGDYDQHPRLRVCRE